MAVFRLRLSQTIRESLWGMPLKFADSLMPLISAKMCRKSVNWMSLCRARLSNRHVPRIPRGQWARKSQGVNVNVSLLQWSLEYSIPIPQAIGLSLVSYVPTLPENISHTQWQIDNNDVHNSTYRQEFFIVGCLTDIFTASSPSFTNLIKFNVMYDTGTRFYKCAISKSKI